jgi:hypothetical protein
VISHSQFFDFIGTRSRVTSCPDVLIEPAFSHTDVYPVEAAIGTFKISSVVLLLKVSIGNSNAVLDEFQVNTGLKVGSFFRFQLIVTKGTA